MKRRWTQEEIEMVRTEYPTTSSTKLANRIGRKAGYIRYMARKIGVRSAIRHNAEKTNKSKPIGSRVINSCGYVMVKCEDTNGRTQWKMLHRMMWEEHRGPIPLGCFVAFIKGMRVPFQTDPTIDKLQLINKVQLASLISPDEHHKYIALQKRRETLKRKKAELNFIKERDSQRKA